MVRTVLSGVVGALLGLTVSGAAQARGVIVDPPGNRHASQPAVPRGSFLRTFETKSSFESKYEKVRDLIAGNRRLRSDIRNAAAAYGIDPIHIVGALVGEHTYNVDVYDQLQTYYVKAIAYADHRFRFEYNGETVGHFVKRAQFSTCSRYTDSWSLWGCRETIWKADFQGRNVGGERFPDKRFSAVFFQPFFAGQTFGLGQINPLTALKLTDTVHRVSGYPKLDAGDAAGVYDAIMKPEVSLAYIAASIRNAIGCYRRLAGIDISQNPGITATLYNVGSPDERAAVLARENRQRETRGLAPKLPEENYYGWLVNDKLSDLQAIFRG